MAVARWLLRVCGCMRVGAPAARAGGKQLVCPPGLLLPPAAPPRHLRTAVQTTEARRGPQAPPASRGAGCVAGRAACLRAGCDAMCLPASLSTGSWPRPASALAATRLTWARPLAKPGVIPRALRCAASRQPCLPAARAVCAGNNDLGAVCAQARLPRGLARETTDPHWLPPSPPPVASSRSLRALMRNHCPLLRSPARTTVSLLGRLLRSRATEAPAAAMAGTEDPLLPIAILMWVPRRTGLSVAAPEPNCAQAGSIGRLHSDPGAQPGPVCPSLGFHTPAARPVGLTGGCSRGRGAAAAQML